MTMTLPADYYWPNYFFNTDFTLNREELQQFQPGMVLDEETGFNLAAIIDERDKKEGKGQWISDDDPKVTQWNLYGVKVAYNGKNDPDFPTRAKWKNVVRLDFPEGAQGPKGVIYLPYN